VGINMNGSWEAIFKSLVWPSRQRGGGRSITAFMTPCLKLRVSSVFGLLILDLGSSSSIDHHIERKAGHIATVVIAPTASRLTALRKVRATAATRQCAADPPTLSDTVK
jgi:hypothetical protein